VLDVPPGAAPPPVVEIRSVGADEADDDEHGDTHTVTVARGPEAATAGPTTPPDSHTTRRVVLGTVAAVVCLLAVALSLLLFGREEVDAPDATVPAASQVVDIPPPAPQNVTVAPAAAGDQVVVAWEAVGDGSVEMRYQVAPETSDAPPQRTTELSATFAIEPGTEPCFTVVAINPVGRISEKSPLVCL
jgi:hypothetical protein